LRIPGAYLQRTMSLFGNATPANNGGAFGAPLKRSSTLPGNTAAPKLSLFGSTATPPAAGATLGSGLFGQTNTQPQQQTGGLFGQSNTQSQQQQQQQQQQQTGGLFGQANTQPQQQSGGLFGQSNNQPPQQQAGGLFGQSNNQPQQQNQAGGLFGQANTQQQQQQQNTGLLAPPGGNMANTFGQSQQNAPAQGFGGSTLFSSLGGAQSTNPGLAQSQAPASSSSYFDQMLERGKKRDFTGNGGIGDLPSLQLGLSDIARKARNLGTGGPSAGEAQAGAGNDARA
jgi:hypothetical protein